ncbi:hypothetical protein [Gordonia otitidis]|uniref:Uncharacterized protein n=1 Tax=Gordonia otitidis (strain DSM 44809 / CCUG 52243 / JCM 12355 / NBRC 100426 / IFM 10032) TaxID=1108044 RepID=H5TTT9_GORO1|nr:hypothetical protein [Gordonia otitidis]GAB36897.1 hypothetical protein GOOTI_242_00110 [Gordonia otitidis NBRC 100426]
MDGQGCWSTVVCSAEERRALGLSGSSEWLLQCRLAAGHAGNHATDASTRPRSDRRLWLEWNDFDDRAQSLIERNPCPVLSPEGARCVFFNGHGGPHFYARTNGHVPAVNNGARRPAASGRMPVQGNTPPPPQARRPERSGPSTGDLPVAAANAGSHRLDEPRGQSVREVPPAQHSLASQPTPSHAYRGGRRSTNAEPPATPMPIVNRHQAVDTESAQVVGQPPVPPSPPRADPLSGPVSAPPVNPRTDEVSEALRDVAAALAKLADALERPRS